MVLKESLFLVNVLCSLVPCDVKYPYPDTYKDPDALKHHFKIEYNGPVTPDQQINFNLGHPIVYTQSGKIEGFFMKVVGGRKIFAFEGIPYAEPPTGHYRFKPPTAKHPWEGLYQANEKGPDCIQYNMLRLKRTFGEENCLFLNVYSPYIPSQGLNISNIPVLVWFHDGGFLQGSGSDVGPSYLLQNDVILVTINYRLGVLGFMSTGDSVSPGNYGLKDQVLALQWVNQNIQSFNGDPSRVTLIGQGSGGANVHLQMISPRARNLFSSAISLSGTAFNYWSFHSMDEAKNLTHYYGKLINCPVHNGSQVLVDCLRQIDAFDLVQFQIPLLDDWFAPVVLFRPTLEDAYQNQPFLTETPEEAYNKGSVANVPYMASFTADEGLTYLLLHAVVGSIKMLRKNWDELAPDFLDYEQFPIDIHEVTRRITWFYLKEINAENAPLSVFADMVRDRFILGGVHKALQAHCQIAPTYSYVFAYNGKYNLGTSVGYKPHEWGVGHGEDVYYIVNSTLKYSGFKRTDPELILSKIMVNLISNFAHKGEPIFTTEKGEDIRIWNPITDPKNMSMLLINKWIKMIPEPFIKNIHFWESLGLPDSLPLNFGSANPGARNFENGQLTNVLGVPKVVPQIQVPIFENKEAVNTGLPLNNGLDPNFNYNVNEGKVENNYQMTNDRDPQYDGERAPEKTNANLYNFQNNNANSPNINPLNQNNRQQYENQENFQFTDTNSIAPEQNQNNYNNNDPNAPLSQGREGNKLDYNNNANINLFQNNNNNQQINNNPLFNSEQILSRENGDANPTPLLPEIQGQNIVQPNLDFNSNSDLSSNINGIEPPGEIDNNYYNDPKTEINEEKVSPAQNEVDEADVKVTPDINGDFGNKIIVSPTLASKPEVQTSTDDVNEGANEEELTEVTQNL